MAGRVPEVPTLAIEVVPKGEGLANHWLGGAIHTLEAGPSSQFAYACTIATMAPHGGPSWHVHTREEEFFSIRRGTFRFEAAGADAVEVGPGGLVALPIGVPHRFRNLGDEPGEVVLWTAPGGNAQFFLDLSNPLSEEQDATLPPDIDAMREVGRSYGITMLDPDLADPAAEILPLANARTAAATQAGQGETLAIGDATARVLATSDTTGRQCELFELTIPPGGRTPRVQHGRYTLGMVMEDGGMVIKTDGGGIAAAADSLVRIPFGADYALANPGDASVTLVALVSPGGWLEAWRTGDLAGYGIVERSG